MAGCFDPGIHVFEYQASGDWCRVPLHSTCSVNHSIMFERRQAYRLRCKNSKGLTRSGMASVSASIYGVESGSPSLLSVRDLLLQLPVTARRFIAGALAGVPLDFLPKCQPNVAQYSFGPPHCGIAQRPAGYITLSQFAWV